jgi:hypothetical protein
MEIQKRAKLERNAGIQDPNVLVLAVAQSQ